MAARRTKLRFGNHLRLIASVVVMACGPARAAEVWRERAPMPTTRLALAASVVDGKIYAVGGRAEGALVTEYDPATDTWTTKTPMPTARFGLATAVVDDRIYAIGGGLSQTLMFRTVEEYDPLTDTWTKKADLPESNVFFSTSVVDGKVYAIGGAANPPWSIHFQTVYAYDPQTDTWTQKAEMPTARAFLSTSVVDGKIYAIGGALVTKTMVSTVEVYDPATDTWATKAPMPTARFGHTTAVVDGIIYAIGGGTHTPSLGFSAVEAYDPTTDTWTTRADMPAPTCWHSTGVVDGRIYAFGGSPSGYEIHPPGFSTVYEYIPSYVLADFNGDGIVDGKDVLIMTAHWGQDDPLCDLAPPPFGDGIIDAMDLELLMSYWEQPVDDPTLTAHWALDETEGTVAYDSAGVNDGAVTGIPAWQPDGGTIDGALEFDGATFAAAGRVLSPSDGPFSVLAWIKGGTPGQVVISQRDSVGGVDWLLADSVQGRLMTELKYPGRGGCSLCSEIVITDGDWHRLGFIWDGSYRTLYVDDMPVAEDMQKGLADVRGGLYIGCGKDMVPGTFFTGLIDDVRIYNRAVRP